MIGDKDFKTQRRRVQALLDKWLQPLGLLWWKIDVTWDKATICDDKGPDREHCLAHVHVQWEYLQAAITFHLFKILDENDENLERIVVHELCHILVKEMRAPIAPSDEVNDEWRKHEERVVSALASAFLWTRRDGERAGEKSAQPAPRKRISKPVKLAAIGRAEQKAAIRKVKR